MTDEAPIDEALWSEVLVAFPPEPPGPPPYALAAVGGNSATVVDGDEVKTREDLEEDADSPHMDFIEGGNDLEAAWVRREFGDHSLILDGNLAFHDLPFVLYHEAHERRDMAGGMSYGDAHARANAGERALRIRERDKKSMDHLSQLKSRKGPLAGAPGWALALDGKAAFADPLAGLVMKDGKADFDPKSASARFLITSARRDRHGDVVLPEGCKDSLAEYAANPVVFFGHNSNGLPVGSCRDAAGAAALEFTAAGVVGTVKFHLKTRESEEVAALVEAGELRGASIGFLPVEAQVHEGKLERLDDDSKVIKFEPFLSFTFLKWKLMEWSVVAVPANAETLRCRLDKGVGGKPLSDGLRAYLAQYAEAAKAWSNGVDLSEQPPTAAKAAEEVAVPVVEKGEPPAKRPPRKPGELFFHKTLRAIDDHHGHYERALDDQEHPEVAAYARDSMAKMAKHRKSTLAKAEELYPMCDFSMGPMACAAEPATAMEVAEETVTPDLDLVALEAALATLSAKATANAEQLRRATGRS